MSETKSLPWICPQHPKAQIRHLWDRSQYVMNGYTAGRGIDTNHRYECADCGLELASPEESGKGREDK